jgi:hypothetical protein
MNYPFDFFKQSGFKDKQITLKLPCFAGSFNLPVVLEAAVLLTAPSGPSHIG